MSVLSNKIILLNAPRGAGKDTIGLQLQSIYGCSIMQFKESLYRVAYPFTSCESYEHFMDCVTDRDTKELVHVNFRGMSPRNFLIYISEKIVKPHFGSSFFGEEAANHITEQDISNGVVFTDSGFIEEAMPLGERFGFKNLYIIQFTGQGSNNFKGDSREFINVPNARTIRMGMENTSIAPSRFAQQIAQEVVVNGNQR